MGATIHQCIEAQGGEVVIPPKKNTQTANASIRKKAARRLEKSNVAQAAANAIKKLT
jgi:hypothetical protein